MSYIIFTKSEIHYNCDNHLFGGLADYKSPLPPPLPPPLHISIDPKYH